MPDFFEMEITGDKGLIKNLETLDKKVAKKVIKSAMRKGAAIIRKRTKALTPRDTGVLRRSIVTRVAKRSGRTGSRNFALLQNFNVKKFPSLIKKTKNGRYFYPAGVEYGRAARKGGPKVTRAVRFIRRAFLETKDRAANKILDEIRKGMFKIWDAGNRGKK